MDTHQLRKQLTAAGWSVAIGAMIAFVGAGPVKAGPASSAPMRLVDTDQSGMNLTSAQQQKLTALENASRAQSSDLFTQLQQIRRKLSDVYRKYDLDTAAAAKLNQDLNRIQGQLLDQRLSDQQQLRKILTSDQFAQLQSSIQRRPRPDEGHGGPGGPGGQNRGHRDRNIWPAQ